MVPDVVYICNIMVTIFQYPGDEFEVAYCIGKENCMETTTLQRLKAAGWKCGRKIDISSFKKRYREIGLEMPANVEAFLEEFGLLHIENLKWFRDVDFNPLEAIGINLDAEYFENLLDEYDINTTTYPLGMCCTNELFLVMTITNEFYCFTNGCCELCGIGVEDMLDCLIGECRISKTIE